MEVLLAFKLSLLLLFITHINTCYLLVLWILRGGGGAVACGGDKSLDRIIHSATNFMFLCKLLLK